MALAPTASLTLFIWRGKLKLFILANIGIVVMEAGPVTLGFRRWWTQAWSESILDIIITMIVTTLRINRLLGQVNQFIRVLCRC